MAYRNVVGAGLARPDARAGQGRPLRRQLSWRMLALRALPFLALFLLACGPGPASPHYAVGDDAETLRADFNEAAGRVRVLMIVAPT